MFCIEYLFCRTIQTRSSLRSQRDACVVLITLLGERKADKGSANVCNISCLPPRPSTLARLFLHSARGSEGRRDFQTEDCGTDHWLAQFHSLWVFVGNTDFALQSSEIGQSRLFVAVSISSCCIREVLSQSTREHHRLSAFPRWCPGGRTCMTGQSSLPVQNV